MRSIRFHIDQLIARERLFLEAEHEKIERTSLSEHKYICNDSNPKTTNKQTNLIIQ
jgi:hypothetical protein